jgi:hypothetical protein
MRVFDEIETSETLELCCQCFEKLSRLKLLEDEAEILKKDLLKSFSQSKVKTKEKLETARDYFRAATVVFLQRVREVSGTFQFEDLVEVKTGGKWYHKLQ